MSRRAIQRLRQDRGSALIPLNDAETDEEKEDDGEFNVGKKTTFAGLADFGSDDDGSSEAEEENEETVDNNNNWKSENYDDKPLSSRGEVLAGASEIKIRRRDKKKDASSASAVVSEGDDIDALLQEFVVQSEEASDLNNSATSDTSIFHIVTANLDLRDFDVDYAMRTALHASSGSMRRVRIGQLFGVPRDGRVRPPHFVGGGIGMTSYDRDPFPLPWPYNRLSEHPEIDRWYSFTHSENYKRECEGYRFVQDSGDPNALALFVADHPFITEALLQLSQVLYQTSQRHEAMTLLRRALWVYECASLSTFTKINERICHMDHEKDENSGFFRALFQLIRVSYVQG